MSYDTNPLIHDVIGKHGITTDIAKNFSANDPVKFLILLGEEGFAKRAKITKQAAAQILDEIHDAYSGIPSRRRGGRDGSGMMM